MLRIRNNDPVDLEASEGDNLEVVVHSGGDNAVLTCVSPDGADEITPETAHTFRVPPFKDVVQVHCRVRVNCTFMTNADGSCEVRLRDTSGNFAPHVFRQSGSQAIETIRYRIQILPAAGAGGGQ